MEDCIFFTYACAGTGAILYWILYSISTFKYCSAQWKQQCPPGYESVDPVVYSYMGAGHITLIVAGSFFILGCLLIASMITRACAMALAAHLSHAPALRRLCFDILFAVCGLCFLLGMNATWTKEDNKLFLSALGFFLACVSGMVGIYHSVRACEHDCKVRGEREEPPGCV